MRILLWHVHGSWTTSFVQGAHDYLIPVTPDRGPYGLGRATSWEWPASARELTPEQLHDAEVDVVVLQRPEELDLAERWLGRRPGRDVPAVYLEHNTPKRGVPNTAHPMREVPGLTLVHVTHFNELFWDNGAADTAVIEHGVIDPGARYTGELERAAVVLNDPIRRNRITGTDLLPALAAAAPIDLFGMRVTGIGKSAGVTPYEDLPQHRMHDEIARRRVYVHPLRWTSLGLTLIEAMCLAMPVVVLASTDAVEAVPPGAGVLSTRLDRLVDGIRRFRSDADAATEAGQVARAAALERYGLARFLYDWDRLLKEVTR